MIIPLVKSSILPDKVTFDIGQVFWLSIYTAVFETKYFAQAFFFTINEAI